MPPHPADAPALHRRRSLSGLLPFLAPCRARLAAALLLVLASAAMLAVTSLWLAAVTLVLLVAVGRKVRRLSRASQDRAAEAAAVAAEISNAIPTVQAFTLEAAERARFGAEVERSFAVAIQGTRLRAGLTAGLFAGRFGAIVFVLQLGAQAVIDGAMTPGTHVFLLIIAHRLATVGKADRIVVMDERRIVEQGPSAVLLQQGGLYTRLAALQIVQ